MMLQLSKQLRITAALAAIMVSLNTAPSLVAEDQLIVPERTWQGIPGLERTGKGRVFVSWFTGGPKEPAPENTVVLAHSDDGGKTFSVPQAMALRWTEASRPTSLLQEREAEWLTLPQVPAPASERPGRHLPRQWRHCHR